MWSPVACSRDQATSAEQSLRLLSQAVYDLLRSGESKGKQMYSLEYWVGRESPECVLGHNGLKCLCPDNKIEPRIQDIGNKRSIARFPTEEQRTVYAC